ncbi:MAG: hypothetical protein NC218_07305 [Acetobacter sp.]|nr:hypothetical protein [Acetobacter sp.]
MNNLLIIFIILNIINVVIQTIKSLATVKCGKVGAAVANALAYGFYTIVVVYMVCELDLWLKVVIVGACNLVGVFIVKWVEEIGRKDKIWKVEVSVRNRYTENVVQDLNHFGVSYNYIATSDNKWVTFNVYCSNQKETQFVHEICKNYNAKYFITETKSF